MLCKTTMRAALAHVLGMVGILGAFGAGALHEGDAHAVPKYATELLKDEVADIKDHYMISASEAGHILIYTKIDTLLDTANEDHFMVLKFGDAKLVRQLRNVDNTNRGFRFRTCTSLGPDKKPFTGDPAKDLDGDGETTGPGEAAEDCSAVTGPALTRAYRGDPGDSAVVYKVDGNDIAINTYMDLELGSDVAPAAGVAYLAVKKEAATHKAEVYIYDDLGAARSAATGTPGAIDLVFSGESTLFKVEDKVQQPGVKAHLATADVAHPRDPFVGFLAADTGSTPNYGVLATITVREKPNTGFLNQNGRNATAVLRKADFAVASSVPGAFKFGNGADKQGPAHYDSKTKKGGGAPTAFMVSTEKSCTNGPLTLKKGKEAINPNPAGTAGITATFADEADNATASQSLGSAAVEYVRYFCVLVSENTIPIPRVGDPAPDALNGYTITVTPIATGDFKTPGTALAGASAGAIDRNGTTVNISYLSDHEAYNQRLVIVNRSAQVAEYQMDDFQTEEGIEVLDSTDIQGTVPPRSRKIVRMQDKLALSGGTRAAGILTLNAASTMIDVMTLQIHPGTGQIDTTVYQND